MTDFIREFYRDNLKPQSCRSISDELAAECERMSELENKLCEMLDGEARKLFIDYVNTCNSADALGDEENYINGFRFGAYFAVAAFGDSNDSFLRDDS